MEFSIKDPDHPASLLNGKKKKVARKYWGEGGHNGKKQVCFKMCFRSFKVFLDHVIYFFFNGKWVHREPTHPALMENSIIFFFFNETFP